ncbi:SDH family Clp fold serine proteinase [Streptomyces humidus]|uniref:SDH family Clp fold serine proteinase n=1 Tax=Streptomyces humidus TaxID=52259 RepID=UPI0033197397
MNGNSHSEQILEQERASAFSGDGLYEAKPMTEVEHRAVVSAGNDLAKHAGGVWLLITGKLTSANSEPGTDSRLRDALLRVFGYPRPEGPDRRLRINLLLDSPGGSLDCAYAMALYLAAYTDHLKVFVPRKAKSASTLLALGGCELHMSAFGELGPLDTQVHDPRNPANHVSALDCYQSVDYVRKFGRTTMDELVNALITTTERKVSAGDLLDKASGFALGAVQPMLQGVSALDFGGWGRSLMIGERYTRKLLEAKKAEPDQQKVDSIANQLVYGYTHHLFPIDCHEARRIGLPEVGLPVKTMKKRVYQEATRVLELCRDKSFVGFLSRRESEHERKAAETVRHNGSLDSGRRRSEHAQGLALPVIG